MMVPYRALLIHVFFFVDVSFPSFETLKRMSKREAESRKAARGREVTAVERPGGLGCIV